MADQTWYVAVNGNREGPFSDQQFREQITRGQVGADTLVWNASMTAWTKGGDVPGLVPRALRVSAQGLAPADGGQPGDPLSAEVGTWALFGRTLLVAICQFLIIPTPWAVTAFYRWFIAHIRMPNAKPVTFEGRPGDIWYIFMLSALCGYGGFIHISVQLLLMPLTVWFYLIILRWIFANLAWPGQSARLQFTGTYWPLLGWSALAWVAMFTIIGWAWVLTAMLRWLCRNVQGSSKQLSFVGGGWGVLWRTFAFALSCIVLIPIPWTFRWYTRWLISQFCLSKRA